MRKIPGVDLKPLPENLILFAFQKVDGVRVDTGVCRRRRNLAASNPTILKAIAHGATRQKASAKLIEFLSELEITGVSSNRNF